MFGFNEVNESAESEEAEEMDAELSEELDGLSEKYGSDEPVTRSPCSYTFSGTAREDLDEDEDPSVRTRVLKRTR